MVVMVFTCRRVLTVSCPCPTKTAEAREPPLPVKVTALAPEGTLAGIWNEPSSVPLPSAVPETASAMPSNVAEASCSPAPNPSMW